MINYYYKIVTRYFPVYLVVVGRRMITMMQKYSAAIDGLVARQLMDEKLAETVCLLVNVLSCWKLDGKVLRLVPFFVIWQLAKFISLQVKR
jgi:hypothetical protein